MKPSQLLRASICLVVLALAVALSATPASAANSVYVVNGNSQFGVVDLSSGAFQPIGAPTPEPQASLVWGASGSLFTLGTVSGNLETINPATGATTVVGPTGLPFFSQTGLSTASLQV